MRFSSATKLLSVGALLALIAPIAFLPSICHADPVDDYLHAEMVRNHIPGISVAVIRDGKVIKLRSYGQANLEWNTRTNSDTAFPLASVTKPVTATIVMRLVSEGKLAIDAPVSRYLPDAPATWQGITVCHLLSHTSGIPDDLHGAQINTAADAFTASAKLPLNFAPGTQVSYGITGYTVLQHLIERVAGKSFPSVLQEQITTPLQMRNARFDYATQAGPGHTSLVPRRASVYEWSAAQNEQRQFSFLFSSHSYTAGGLYASSSDLARWMVALDKGAWLSAPLAEQMWTAIKLPDGTATTFGLGWVVGKYRGERTVGHSGGPALADILRFVDKKLTIIVLANQQRMYPYLAQGVADFYIKAPAIPQGEPITDTFPQLTKNATLLFQSLAKETIPSDVFAPERQQALAGMLEQFVMPWFRSLGAPHRIQLIKDENKGELRVRHYRVHYAKKVVLWRFHFNHEKISAMEPVPE